MHPAPQPTPPRHAWQLTAAFAAVYLIWGSTYLAIAIAVETMPPLLMAAARFLTAGLLLFAWQRLRRAPLPGRAAWRAATVTGVLLLLCGNGAVCWAEQWVPSGIAALLIATTPLWMAVLPWIARRAPPPSTRVLAGIALGLTGTALLCWAPGMAAVGRAETIGAVVILLAAVCWAWGSLWSRYLPLPASPLESTALQMLAGGAALLGAAALRGELALFRPEAVSTASVLALVYLVLIGGIAGFGAYVLLLRWTTPSRAATYAYVNPVVAVALGWLFHGEPLTTRTLVAGGLIVIAVLVTLTARRPAGPVPAPAAVDGRPADRQA